MNQPENTKRQTVITRHEGLGKALCSIAKESQIGAVMEPVEGRFQLEINCDAKALSGLNEAACKALLPASANWEVDNSPNGGVSPFVDIYDPTEDLDGPPIGRFFLS